MMALPAEDQDNAPDFGTPTPDREKHGVVREVDIAPTSGHGTVRAYKDVESSTIDRLLNRRLIDDTLHQAGERLYADWFTAGLSQRLVLNMQRVRGGVGEKTDKQIDAKRRFDAAMYNVGAYLNDVLFDIVVEDKTVTDVEKSRGWGKGGGMPVVRIALTKLAVYYGIGAAKE